MAQQPQQQVPQAPLPAGSGGPEVLRNLMVNYIPASIDEAQLRQLFEMYGPIESIKIVTDRETRQSRGYGFVKYQFAYSAVHAIQYLNGYPLMNKRLKVAYANASEAQKVSAEANPFAAQQAGAAMMYPGAQGGAGQDPNSILYMQQMAAMMQAQQQFMMQAQQQQQQQQQAGQMAHQGGRGGGGGGYRGGKSQHSAPQ